MTEVTNLLEMFSRLKLYDLEFERFFGMPVPSSHDAKAVQPSYFYSLYRHHGSFYEPATEGPRTSASGQITMSDHAGTHIDALCHQAVDLKLYGGIPVTPAIETPWGFMNLGAEQIPPIVKRGVLIDVAGYKSVEYLPERYEVTEDDVKQTCEWGDVEVQEGDVVLVRTGYGKFWLDAEKYLKHAGISKGVSRWMAERNVYAVGADNMSWDPLKVVDPELNCKYVGHIQLMVRRGIYILENVYLEEVARDKCYEFIFIGLPLKCRGATGSPLRPIALGLPEKS